MRIERMTIAAITAAVLTSFNAPLRADTWSNHIDASMIHEILPRDGLLYMATYGGVLLFDPADQSFTQYRNDSGLPSNSLRCLAFDDDGDIYVGTADVGVAKVRIANGRLRLLRSLSEQIDGLASNTVNSLAWWDDAIVYGATPGAGLIRNDFASARYFQRDGLPGSDVVDVLPLGDEVWMATVDDSLVQGVGGLAVLNKLGIIRRVAGSPKDDFVLGTDGTNIWVGTDTGVRRYEPATDSWTNMSAGSVVATFRIRSLFHTGSTMWAGAGRNFMRYTGSGTTWNVFSPDSVQNGYELGGNVNRDMKGLAVMPNGDVYLGNTAPALLRGSNLIRFDGTNTVNLKPNAPAGSTMLRLDVDIDGALWASYSNFYVGKLMPDGNWLNYNPSTRGIQLPSNESANIAFLADSQGHKWFSTLSNPLGPEFHPLDELDDQRDGNFANDVWVRHALDSGGGDGYGTLRPQRAAEDPAGNRWFLSDNAGAAQGWKGIHILSRDKSAWFQMTQDKDPRMIADNVTDVAFGPNYTYVAFRNNGVYVWNHRGFDWTNLTTLAQDTWTQWVPVTELPSGTSITRLELATDGRLWIATEDGLFYTDGGGIAFEVPPYTGIGPGIVSPKVNDVLLDHQENIWVATDLGLNRISRTDYNDIQTFLTPASYLILAGLRYPLDVISPLAHADCRSLEIHPTRDILYVGTFSGISEYDFSAPPSTATDLSTVYVYPNPVYTTRGHVALKIANLTGPVTVEIYNIEGELVDSHTVSTDGDVAWDLTTRDGFNASSGKYIVRIVNENGSVQRPFALVR